MSNDFETSETGGDPPFAENSTALDARSMTETPETPADLSVISLFSRMLLFLLAGAGLIVALVYPFPLYGRHWSAIFDMAHSITFFSVFVLIAGLMDPASVGWPGRSTAILRLTGVRLNLLFTLLFAAGVVCELAQAFVQRQPALIDVLSNAAGLLAGLLYCRSRMANVGNSRWRLLAGAAALVLTPCVQPTLELIECRKQQIDFPLLASFERSRELTAWKAHDADVSISQKWFSHGACSLKIVTRGNSYPGAEMVWPISDWNACAELALDLHNPESTPVEIGITVFDRDHSYSDFEPTDRYGTSVIVAPQSSVTIVRTLGEIQAAPQSRQMDLARIASLNIFLMDSQFDRCIYVDHVRLVK